mmetsp:Transcript_24518/g.61704  ORF Transcript_24518/g.61704 Transcript_24518/m.61704 type:complete len:261 (-) Transcript_24518:3058-3840(-)
MSTATEQHSSIQQLRRGQDVSAGAVEVGSRRSAEADYEGRRHLVGVAVLAALPARAQSGAVQRVSRQRLQVWFDEVDLTTTTSTTTGRGRSRSTSTQVMVMPPAIKNGETEVVTAGGILRDRRIMGPRRLEGRLDAGRRRLRRLALLLPHIQKACNLGGVGSCRYRREQGGLLRTVCQRWLRWRVRRSILFVGRGAAVCWELEGRHGDVPLQQPLPRYAVHGRRRQGRSVGSPRSRISCGASRVWKTAGSVGLRLMISTK